MLWQRRAAARDLWPHALCALPRAGQPGTSAARGASLVSPVLCAIYGSHQRQLLTLHMCHRGDAHALLQGCGARTSSIPSLVSWHICSASWLFLQPLMVSLAARHKLLSQIHSRVTGTTLSW